MAGIVGLKERFNQGELLDKRQVELIVGALSGDRYGDVAEGLDISEGNAKKLAQRAINKLGLRGQRDLVNFVFEEGVEVAIGPEDLLAFQKLSEREHRVAQCLADGWRNDEIMAAHDMTEITVSRDVKSLSLKFDANTLNSAFSFRAVQIYRGQHESEHSSVTFVL